MNIMEYKGYHAHVEYSQEDKCLVGKVIGIEDLILIYGDSVSEFEKDFHEAIDDYLDMCERHGKVPSKRYSGNFKLRLTPELHCDLSIAASREGTSLNSYVADACLQKLHKSAS